MLICAGNGEEFEGVRSVGVGLIESTITLTEICAHQKPECLIFLGSAGSYSLEVELLSLYTSTHATQIESSLLTHASYTPLKQSIDSLLVPCETIERIHALGLEQMRVNSSNYITTDRAHAVRMLERGIGLENMEFFALMSVAQRYGVPAMGVFCVSNYCHAEAHSEFVQNHRAVKEKLQNLANGILGR